MSQVDPDPERIPPTFSQKITIDSYTEGIKAALSSSDAACEKILTAAISLTTVYGAVLTLVAPKDEAAGIITALPFIGFAVAALSCMWGHSRGIGFASDDKYKTVKDSLTSVIDRKRWAARIAVLMLAISLGFAGYIVSSEYGKQPEEESKVASITLSKEAHQTLSQMCGNVQSPVRGVIDQADTSSTLVTITLKSEDCPKGDLKFEIPATSVMLVEFTAP